MNTRPVRLAVLAASPVYYQAALYRRVAADPHVDFTAIFASNSGIRPYDGGYGRAVTWDVDALQGYRSVFLRKAGTNPTGGSFLALRDLDIVGELLRGRYEVLWLHGYNSMTHVLAVAAQRLASGGVLFREEQTLLHPRPPWKTALKEFGLRALFRQGAALCIGTQNKRWFQHYGVPAERLFFTPYCVDNERMQAAAAELRGRKEELRRAFGMDDAAGPVIVTVGRLIPKKQPLFLLDAFKHVRSHRQCCLLVVGAGELEGRMRRKVEQEAIPDVVFAGFLNQTAVPRAYACADIFALASREHETWGLVVNEAMNFALPVVVSDRVGCATDLVRQGRNGFVVSSTNRVELVDALLKLVDSADLRQQFGKVSLDIINRWNYDVAARGVLEATAWAVGSDRWNASVQQEAGTAKEEAAMAGAGGRQ